MVTETGKEDEVRTEYPNIVERFREVFLKLGIKKAEGYVDHCAKGDLEDLEDVERKLYELGLHPSLRSQVVNFWAAEIKQPVPQKVKKQLAQERGGPKPRHERGGEEIEEALFTVDVDESGVPKMRMVKDNIEPGVTLEKAKAFIKEIGKEREEPIVDWRGDLGRHMPNFKSPWVKQNLAAAWATATQMDKASLAGETPDPLDIMIDQQAKIMQVRELMGGGAEVREKGTLGEVVTAVKNLQEMAREGKVGELPEWMSDPLKFMETVRGVSGAGERAGGPTWLNDPAEFIKTVREITGGGKTDDAVTTQLAELTKKLEDIKEERQKDLIAALSAQITRQQEAHEKEMAGLVAKIEEMGRPTTGKTEMDILHEVADKGLDVIKTETAGMRSLIRDVLGGDRLPLPKTPGQRAERIRHHGEALETDEKIDQLGRRIFFPQT